MIYPILPTYATLHEFRHLTMLGSVRVLEHCGWALETRSRLKWAHHNLPIGSTVPPDCDKIGWEGMFPKS